MEFDAEHGVVQSRLENGLGVLLKEDHSGPIAAVWTWYRVGSRNEVPGRTGVSHWVEHMQFKGTPTLAKGQIFRNISRVGGTLNALTSQDWTAYFETVPSSQVDLALAIESDRMTSSLFDPEEVDSERTVIISERHGAENNPGFALYEEVSGAAFHAHPYRHMIIGNETDLRSLAREDLYTHYRRFYHPANAFIVAVGDFAADELLSKIQRAFGAIPPGGADSPTAAVEEPPQPGERRVLLRKLAGAPYFRMAFHAPAAASADHAPLLVADAILSGAKARGFGAGVSLGRSSRLYRALVASGLARTAGSDYGVTLDPYLFQIGVTGLPESDLARIEHVVDEELRLLRDEEPTPEELQRATRQLEAQLVYGAEGVSNQAYWLGQWQIADRWQRAFSLIDEIRALSGADVQRAAQRYLPPEERTVGWLVPTRSSSATGEGGHAAQAFVPIDAWGLSGPITKSSLGSYGFRRELLPNGIPVLGQDRHESRSVSLRLRVAAGSIYENEAEPGLACFTAASLLRGADGKTFDEINARTDRLGSSIAIDAGREFVEARMRCLRDDLAEIVDLLAAAVQRPDFPAAEVEKVKASQLGLIAEQDSDTRAAADRLLRRGIFPEPNPLGRRLLGERPSVESFDTAAARTFHARTFGPSGATIAVVGGLGEFEATVELLSRALGSWDGHQAPPPTPDIESRRTSSARFAEEIAGKSQTDLALGTATISRGDPDYYALDLANLILGRLGLMGRLGAEVRDRQGLAYYVFSQIEARNAGSIWSARAGVAAENADRALEAIVDQIRRLAADGITDEELQDAKSYSIGSLPLRLETHDGVAVTLQSIDEFALGLDFLDRYPSIIAGVSKEDVRSAAARHLDPGSFVTCIAGSGMADG